MGSDPLSNITIPESDSSSLYYKFQPGDNRFRIVGDWMQGYEDWSKELRLASGAPLRSKNALAQKGDQKPRYFALVPIWVDGAIKFISIHQKTILTTIDQLNYSKDWGVCTEYDIMVKRQGEGKDGTLYTVTPCKPEPQRPECKKAWEETEPKIDFDAYIAGGSILKTEEGAVEDTELPF
tara:strand:- start:486 stop:1025 length:540 start_codon:yes stop_codon:yes gene_type:complete